MIYKFYDTCSLLKNVDHMFQEENVTVVVSSITLEELEGIKTAVNKDADTKYSARKATKALEEYYGAYEIALFKPSYQVAIVDNEMPLNNDAKIIMCAIRFRDEHLSDEVIFVTNDISCKHLARIYFGEQVESIVEEKYDYDGYKEVYLDDDGMVEFYSNPNTNIYNLLINEYLLIYNKDTGECVDRLCWTGEEYRHLNYNSFDSRFFGSVKPMKNDVYQSLVADSFNTNKITMVKGPAGSGKTYLSLGFLLHKLERNKIDKIIVFCNTVATKNSAKLGYYPGTRDEKLLDSQIGNLLSSKFGGRIAVEQMIQQEQLVLLPMSDIRGYDTSGMRAGIYISEAQNLDVDLMKLTLQRIGEDSICIIDGDCKTQVDDINFAGSNNGMRRASQVFRGHDVYGEVTLRKIHRSKVALIAEDM